jgi:hypothetical protein
MFRSPKHEPVWEILSLPPTQGGGRRPESLLPGIVNLNGSGIAIAVCRLSYPVRLSHMGTP